MHSRLKAAPTIPLSEREMLRWSCVRISLQEATVVLAVNWRITDKQITLSWNQTVTCNHTFKLVIMCKTLIAEDNTTFRKLLSTILCNRFPSMIIEEAANGREVLEKVESSVPDLVFMDIGLPDANGLKLTRKIKTSHPGIVIVIFTNYDLPEYRDAALRFGATSFIAKSSWTSEQIIALVESILSDMNQ